MTKNEPPDRDKRTGGHPQDADTSSVGAPSRDSEFPRWTLDDVLDCLGWANGSTSPCATSPSTAFSPRRRSDP